MLVGRSHECDYPPQILNLPQVTAPKFVLDGRSYQIDQRIKAILAEGLSVYRVDVEALRRLRPDVIVTQVQCEVCAVSLSDIEKALAEISGYAPVIVPLNPNSLSDIWEDVRRIARALEREKGGEELIVRMQTEMGAITDRVAPAARRPTVVCVEWLEPLMAAGNWMPELVEIAGGENLFGEAGKHSPWMTFADLAKSDPDKILLLPCGFDISRTESELPDVFGKADWSNLRAYREKQIFVLDGNQYFNRPGPRIVDSLRILAEIFHPELMECPPSARPPSSGWKRAVV